MARRNVLNNSNPDTKEELSLEYDAAVKFLKASRNRAIFLRVRFDATCKDDPSKHFDLSANIVVNCTQALKALEFGYGKRFPTEALVKLHVFQTAIFIG
jgi:hypothetical protein